MRTSIKINDQYIQKILLGSTPVQRIYQSGSIVYEAGGSTPCFEVVNTISEASGDYVDVYALDNKKWYKRNNLNQYEEYGLMPIVNDLSNVTYYTGKLVILSTDGHEYKWTGSQWNDLGYAGMIYDCIWFDPASNNSSYQIGYYWGTGYKMVCNMYLSKSYSGDTSGFLSYQNKSPLELSFYSNGFYLDMHDPQSTSNNSCYSGDYSQRLMQTSVLKNYQSEQVINFTVTYGTVKAELEEGGALIGKWGTEITGKRWYNGLYNPSLGIGSNRPYHLSRIQVYDNNNNLVNDLKFVENEGETGSQKLSVYDSVLDVKYNNTNSNTPTYHITKKGEINPPEEYQTKVAPADNVHYDTLLELEMMECPWIGMTATVGQDYTVYLYTENGWVLADVPLDLPYLRFTATENTEITFSQDGLDYSIDGGAWRTMTANTSVSVPASSYIVFRGECTPTSSNGIGTFSETGIFNVSGNIMSLLFGDDFTDKVSLAGKNYAFKGLFMNNTKLYDATNLVMPATTLSEYCYCSLFQGCSLLSAVNPNLLPATTLASHCYQTMFYYCVSLKTSPLLPATNLAPYCYYTMFQEAGLTKLPTLPATVMVAHCYDTMFNYVDANIPDNYLPSTQLAPYCYFAMFANSWGRSKTMSILPATTLSDHCYDTMFINNRSISKGPDLPAKTLVTSCYKSLFSGCKELKYIKALFDTVPSSDYMSDWCSVVNGSGVFAMSDDATWNPENYRGTSGIPSGWTVIRESEAEYREKYLTFTPATQGSSVTFQFSSTEFSSTGLSYSIDNGSWASLSANTNTPSVPYGSKIRFRGNLSYSSGKIGKFSASGRFNVEGNIMSLLYGDNFLYNSTITADNIFSSLFSKSPVVNAENLILPSTSLTKYCYTSMFYQCTSLTKAPTLPAITLVSGCYNNMFYSCSSLNYIKAMFTSHPSTSLTSNWVSGVAASGTFVKNVDATWTTTGENGVPTGWTVVTANP